MKQFIKITKGNDTYMVNLANVTEVIGNEKVGYIFFKYVDGTERRFMLGNANDVKWYMNEIMEG